MRASETTGQIEERVREWVLGLPRTVTASTHSLMDNEHTGLFRACADSAIPFDIPSSKGCIAFLMNFERTVLEEWKDELRNTTVFIQGCQRPKTGLFIDPHLDSRFLKPDDVGAYRDFRQAVTKYAINLLRRLGAEPRHPHVYTGDRGVPEPDGYLDYVRTGDWNRPWGTGSHAANQTCELFYLINEGHEEYIPFVREGIEFILSRQNPETGMWGPSTIPLHEQISGALKVIGRFQRIGFQVPHLDRLADSCIRHHADGGFYASCDDMCIPLNIANMCLACLDNSDYRRDDLVTTLAKIADDVRAFQKPDGAFSSARNGTGAIGWCGASVCGASKTPRSNVNGTQGALGCLGLIGAHLGWAWMPWGSSLPSRRDRERAMKYRVVRMNEGRIEIVRV